MSNHLLLSSTILLLLLLPFTLSAPSTIPLTVLISRQLTPSSQLPTIGRGTCICVSGQCTQELSRENNMCVANADAKKNMQPITCRVECCAWCLQYATPDEEYCRSKLVMQECKGEAAEAMGFKGSVFKEMMKEKGGTGSGENKKSGENKGFGEIMRLQHKSQYREYGRKFLIHQIEQGGLIGGKKGAVDLAKVVVRAGLDRWRQR